MFAVEQNNDYELGSKQHPWSDYNERVYVRFQLRIYQVIKKTCECLS